MIGLISDCADIICGRLVSSWLMVFFFLNDNDYKT